MDKSEIRKLQDLLKFLIGIPQDVNSIKEWSTKAPKEIIEFIALRDKFIKTLESSHTESVEAKEKINYIKKCLINLKIDTNSLKFLEGDFYSDQKEFDKAIECWMQISPEYPFISNIYLQIGTIYLEKDNEKEALQWFNKSYELKQDPFVKKLINYAQWELAVIKDYAYFRQWQVITSQHYEKLKRKKEKADLLHIVQKYPTRYAQLKKAVEANKRLTAIDLTNLEEGLSIIKELNIQFPEDPNALNQLKDFLDLLKVGAYRLIPNKISKIAKKTILDLGIKYNRLQAKEIAEKCQLPEDVIIVVINEMLKSKELFGEYFQSTKSIVFDQLVNKKEFDS